MGYDKVYNTKEGFDIPPEHIPSADDMHRLAEGDEKVVGTLIEGLVGFVTGLVQSYVGKRDAFKPYTEDLICEALFCLTEFVNGKLGKAVNRPTSFTAQISGAVKNKLNDWVRTNELTIAPAPRVQRRENTEVLKRHDIKDHHVVTSDEAVFDDLWYDQFMDSLTEEQELVVRLKMDGYTEKAIAIKTGIHRAVVSRILDDLKHIYEGNQNEFLEETDQDRD